MSLQIHFVDMLHVLDNYNFILHDEVSGRTAVVDPSEADGVLEALERHGLSLDVILTTHHHWDHTTGIGPLAEITGCDVVGNAADAARIPSLSQPVAAGSAYLFGVHEVQVIDVSAHTIGHVVYHFAREKAAFTGDALFAMGCGRLFEGTAQQLYDSLQRIMALPDDTRLYCGHEYTVANAKFALSVEPDNEAVQERLQWAEERRREGKPTLPTTVALEKQTNPFVRTQSATIRAVLGMDGASDVEVCAELRRRKDHF